LLVESNNDVEEEMPIEPIVYDCIDGQRLSGRLPRAPATCTGAEQRRARLHEQAAVVTSMRALSSGPNSRHSGTRQCGVTF